ncbi:MAG: peptidylprolyl isomerase [Nanoarchaeota archaeon]
MSEHKDKENLRVMEMEKVKGKDFIEMDFTALTSEGRVFDTTRKEDAKSAGIYNENFKYESTIVCIGEEQVLKGLDEALVGKEVGKEYEIKLAPENAFGKRNAKLIKILPASAFRGKEIEPHAGELVSIDNMLAQIKAVTGGRVVVDFNNPLAGKEIIYRVKLKRKVEDEKEKISSLAKYYLKYFDMEGEIVKVEGIDNNAVKSFKEKVKDILGKAIEVENKKI